MIILGIDPGLAIVGYGVVESHKGRVTPIDYGVINTPAGMRTPLRLQMIHKGLLSLFEKFHPEEIAVEELFFSNNKTTGIPVAEARGVILMTAINYTDKLFEYTPNQIKQAIGGLPCTILRKHSKIVDLCPIARSLAIRCLTRFI